MPDCDNHLDDRLDLDLDDNNADDYSEEWVLQFHLVLTLLPRLGEPAALASAGVPPITPPIMGELFGQVEPPRRPPAPSMDPMAMLGQELPMGLAGWWWWGGKDSRSPGNSLPLPASSSSSLVEYELFN